jgi:prepilin-type N-terminal cleavage/methylation domain-containing protein
MILYRPVQINRNQRGFTLVEVLIAIVIAGIIGSAVTMTIFQVYDSNARSNTHMKAVKEVENAIHYITRDAQMTQSINRTAPDGFPLTLAWVEWDGTSRSVTYQIQDGQLQRIEASNTVVVAQYIDSGQTSCVISGKTLVFTITVTVSGSKPASETRTFTIRPRSAP